jgi:phytoene synthase
MSAQPVDRASLEGVTAFTAASSAATLARQQRDLNECVELMRGGSKTFFAASRLLPARMRSASIALYAFCRVADDLVDNCAAEGRSVQQSLLQLKERLDAVYAGQPQAFVEDRALAAVVHQYQLPRPLLDALLEGFAWDAEARVYETLEDVQAYGARVAGSVGAMMCWLMGVRSADALARACELGVAMQLTNIARDVGEDARNARLYLPRQWLREAGVDVELWLQGPVATPAVKNVIERLLLEADRLYLQSTEGIAALPRDCRAAILAARLIYAEIGEQLRRDGLDAVQHRAVVSTSRKLSLLASAWLQSTWFSKNIQPGLKESRHPEPNKNRDPEHQDSRHPRHQDSCHPELQDSRHPGLQESRHPGLDPGSIPLAATAYLVQHCTHAAQALAEAAEHAVTTGVAILPRRPLGERAEWVLELFERQEALRRARRPVRGLRVSSH